MSATLRLAVLGCVLLVIACEDRDRGGLGPRGTALPPPDPISEAPQAPPARR